MSLSLLRFVLASVATTLLVGCADKNIPNTDVPESEENRKVLDFMERYRRAVEKRDVDALMAMASPAYFDDHGTPSGKDDTDRKQLNAQLNKWKELVISVRYEIRYRKVEFRRSKVFVSFTYTGSFELNRPDGSTKWSRRIGDHRMVLIPHGGKFLISSGM